MLDMARVMPFVREKGARLLGPNCPGLITPGKPRSASSRADLCAGPVGVVSRSGTLTYEVVNQLTRRHRPDAPAWASAATRIIGTNFIDVLGRSRPIPRPTSIVMMGEIGGTDEQEAAGFVKEHVTKPVVGFIAGQTAPPGRRMGHAGAIISGSSGTAAEKIAAFEAAGIRRR